MATVAKLRNPQRTRDSRVADTSVHSLQPEASGRFMSREEVLRRIAENPNSALAAFYEPGLFFPDTEGDSEDEFDRILERDRQCRLAQVPDVA